MAAGLAAVVLASASRGSPMPPLGPHEASQAAYVPGQVIVGYRPRAVMTPAEVRLGARDAVRRARPR